MRIPRVASRLWLSFRYGIPYRRLKRIESVLAEILEDAR